VLALDNLSRIPPGCRTRFAAPAAGWACRQLYTDDEEVLIDHQRQIILTGIEELLSDRTPPVDWTEVR
jgi:hypothetical protein